MRRRPGIRVFSAVLGLWFLLAGREPPFAHPCAMGSHRTTAAASGTMLHGEQAHLSGGHEGHHAAAPEGERPVAPESPAECTCIGDCGAVAPMPTVPLARLALVDQIESRVSSTPHVALIVRTPGAPARVQPFANGPPDRVSL